MKVLIASEGKHEFGKAGADGALAGLVSRLIPGPLQCSCELVRSDKVRIHREQGKGGGYYKRALAWCRYARDQGFDAVVVLIDQDGKPMYQEEFDRAQDESRLIFPRAMGVAVRTFDAWMLADEKALTRVLAMSVQRQPDPEAIRDPKQACAELRDRSRCDLSTSDLYAALARCIDMDQLRKRCPIGFATFADRVRKLATLDQASQN